MIAGSLASRLNEGGADLIVTSGQRLTRQIAEHQAQTSLDSGQSAWATPDVLPWSAWMRRIFEASAFSGPIALPTRHQLLNSAQARVVWRSIVRDALRDKVDDMLGADALLNEVMQSYALLQRYQIDRKTLADAAFDDDSRFLLACIDAMTDRLGRTGWLLEDQLPALLTGHAESLAQLLPKSVLLAGFGQLTPDQQSFQDAFANTDFGVHEISDDRTSPDHVVACASPPNELIAAGQWSRRRLQSQPDARIAVVVPGLSAMAGDARRWFAEGFMPAAQCTSGGSLTPGFELSFGQPLISYPAVACALEFLQVAVRPPRFDVISRLLRSSVLNPLDATTPAALELRLREQPDRRWSLDAIKRRLAEDETEPAWLAVARELNARADEQYLPSAWAQCIDQALEASGWLTGIATDSEVFQLRNAFHTSLNALASLDTVAGPMSLGIVLTALRERVQNTIYQPEGAGHNVLVCGPLETVGLHFDAIWITGLDVTRWPPAGRGASLLPRSLQREYRLPDATPEQTSAFWHRQFALLLAAADTSTGSFAQFDGESELMPAPMIAGQPFETTDVGLGVVPLAGTLDIKREPEALADFDVSRRCHRGQGTLRMLMSDPFGASVQGRWNCGELRQPSIGINAAQRGQLVHRALQLFYECVPDSASLRALDDTTMRAMVARAVADAIRPMFIDADDVLSELLRLEEERCRTLLDRFVVQDSQRPDFEVVALEQSRELVLHGLRLSLRLDRVDRVGRHSLIIDYKTGAKIAGVDANTVVDKHFQLLAYALTEKGALGGLALARIAHVGEPMLALVDKDAAPLARHRQIKSIDTLSDQLPAWRGLAEALAQQFIDGDIRLNPVLSRDERRGSALLSRIAEERRDDG